MARSRLWSGATFVAALIALGFFTADAFSRVGHSAVSQFDQAHATGVIQSVEVAPAVRRRHGGGDQYVITVTFRDQHGTAITASDIVEQSRFPDGQSLDVGSPIAITYNKRFPSSIHFDRQGAAAWNLYWPWLLGVVLVGGLVMGAAVQMRKVYRPAAESPISD